MSANATHLEKLRRSCLGATISRYLRSEIEILQPGKARVTIPFHPELTQNAGFLHGAILFDAADTAGFVAANSVEETYSVLTADFYIRLLRPVEKESIVAVGEVVHRGHSLITTRSDVFNESGKLVAACQGTYSISRILLTDVPGYE
ncbi:MAG TPA: PaaI family thioesterase [Thermoanaerobaculia bacterium]|nr:PaaI family thioesterase [Thermoanaerobaculia bacterium]